MRRAFTLIELLIVAAAVLILAAILFPVLDRARVNTRKSSCQSNLKQIGLGLLQYAQDWNERYALAASNPVASSTPPYSQPYGWADAIQPYVKSTWLLQCPGEVTRTEGVEATEPGFTDYYLNGRLSGRPLKFITNPARTIACGDGNDGRDGTDARYSRDVIPRAWLFNPESPARRKLDAGFYLFADGHVKSLKPEAIEPNLAAPGSVSFAVR